MRPLGRLVPPGASASVLAVRADDGAVVAALDPDRAVTPASNTKLITAALALEHLGPDRRLKTAFAARGRTEDGVLDGDLVVRGTGAPGVDRADIRTLADVAARIDRLEGDLLLDTSRSEGPRFGPGRVWTDARRAYGAPSSASVPEGNVVSVTVRASEEVVAAVDPRTDAVAVDVAARIDPAAAEPDGDDRDLDVHTDPCSGRIRAEGRLPPGAEATVEVPVADPIRHFWAAAGEALSAAGVDVAGSVRIADRPVGTDQQLAAVESASVADLVRSMNVYSDDVVADSLARAVAATVTGEGSWAAWEAVVDDHLSSLGVGTASIRDGSGLSRYSLVPARGVVALLEWVADRPRTDVFYDSLPRPGEGTLADRFDGVTVAAKTGTLTGVRTLSGRVGDGGEAIRFAALVGGPAVDEESVCDRQDDLV